MLKETLQNDLITALKEKDSVKVRTLRLLLSEVKNKEIEKRNKDENELREEELISLIQKESKKRKEAIEFYTQGGREELANKEKEELKVLATYLPEELSEEELQKMVGDAIAQIQPSGPQDFGRVMGAVMKRAGGRADPKVVSALIKRELEN